MVLDLYLISLIVVLITDISGVVGHVEGAIAKWLRVKGVSIYLLECSFCQTFWCCMIYLLYNGQFNLFGIALSLLMAFATPVTKDALYAVRDILAKLISLIQPKN